MLKKTDYNTKITELEKKNPDISNLATKTLVNKVENRIPSISNLDEAVTQNYDIFEPIIKYFKVTALLSVDYVLSWKSRGLNETAIESIKTTNYSLNSSIDNYYDFTTIRLKFNGSFLNWPSSSTIFHGGVVNIYIVYEITSDYKDINYPELKNCLFGSVNLTKNAHIDKFEYSGYGIGFDREPSVSIGNETGKNVIIFGVDMSSSTKIDNRKKDILIPGKGPTQGLKHTLSAEKIYSIRFTKKIQNFAWACIMEQIVIYLSMIKILLSLKQKILKFVHIQIYYA